LRKKLYFFPTLKGKEAGLGQTYPKAKFGPFSQQTGKRTPKFFVGLGPFQKTGIFPTWFLGLAGAWVGWIVSSHNSSSIGGIGEKLLGL